MDLGMGEIGLILVVALLIYGGRLPEVARSLGRSVASLKRGLSETTASVSREIESGTHDAAEIERPRTVRRIARPAPAELATEDVSGGGDMDPPLPDAAPTAPSPPASSPQQPSAPPTPPDAPA